MLRIKRVHFCEALCKCAISSSYRCSWSHDACNSNLHSQTAGEKTKVLREKWSNDCERAEPGLTPSSLTSGLGRLSLPCLLRGGKMGEKVDAQKAELQCYPSANSHWPIKLERNNTRRSVSLCLTPVGDQLNNNVFVMCWLFSFCLSFPIHSTPAQGPRKPASVDSISQALSVLWHPDGFGQWGTCLVVRRWEEGKVGVFISQLLPYLTAVLTVMGFFYRHSPG